MNSVGQLLFNQDDCLECFNHSGEFYSDNLKGVISMRTVNGYFPAYKKNGKLAFASYQQHIQNYIDITDNLYPGALQDLNDSFGVDFLEVVLALHEIEHAWSFSPINDYSKLLKVDELSQDQKVVYEKLRDMTNQLNHAHFGKLVGSSDGLDPHDAVPFIVTDEGKIKICPEDLPPLQPYRFSDIVLYFMGLDNGWDFDSEIQFLNYDQQAEVNLEGVKDGCFLYEIDEPINYSTKEENEFESFIDTITINEIGSIWQPYQCEQKQ